MSTFTMAGATKTSEGTPPLRDAQSTIAALVREACSGKKSPPGFLRAEEVIPPHQADYGPVGRERRSGGEVYPR